MKEIRIGENIAILRKNSHTTQDQLAQALHISSQAVSKWENGINYPDTPTMAKIAEYFRVSIDFLYYGKAEEMETQENKYTGIRAKDLYPNRLIYDYWKEEDLDALTDEEFKLLQKKVCAEAETIEHRSAEFQNFFAGKDGEAIRGDGDAADFRIYRYKSLADNLLISELFCMYERLFTFASRLGVRHIFDIECVPSFQASYLVHHPEMHYTGIDERLFERPYIEESYVNRVFERFTGSDRIKYVKQKYPCELDVPENSMAFAVWKRQIVTIVEWCEDEVHSLASQFDRFVVELVSVTNNTKLIKMDVKDIVRQEVDNYEDIRAEQLENLRNLLPEYDFYILSSSLNRFIVYGTKIKSDREKILEHYDLIGDRIVSDVIDRHWKFEIRRMTWGRV